MYNPTNYREFQCTNARKSQKRLWEKSHLNIPWMVMVILRSCPTHVTFPPSSFETLVINRVENEPNAVVWNLGPVKSVEA